MSARRRVIRTPEGFPRLLVTGRAQVPWEDVYYALIVQPWPQFLLIIVGFFLVLNVAFAVLFYLSPGCLAGAPHTFENAFYFSVQTLATIGYGNIAPATRYSHVLVVIEALIGLLSTAMVTGLVFSKFSRPSSRVLFSNKLVIAPRNGVPTMSFRMANARQNTITDVRLRAFLLVNEVTLEGDVHRFPLDLKLVRETNATFILSWTAMHIIDETSPFFGEGLEKLMRDKVEMYVVLTGTDETFGQAVHSRQRYLMTDIVQNARFADILSFEADGSRHLDYSKFHDARPIKPRKE
jgi:inward rectifier potassium channel